MNYYLSVLTNYAQFSGRARRAEYWNFVLFNVGDLYRIGMLSFLASAFGVVLVVYWAAI
jgi:uncharacterized membrane protein YhaH (DUF805 family)